MAKSKHAVSSSKAARSARKGSKATNKSAQPRPAQQGRRAEKVASEGAQLHPRGTKQAHVIALLQRDSGATLDELVGATGWLPHTTRAALTGLRHKGFVLDKSRREDGTTAYRISSAPEAG